MADADPLQNLAASAIELNELTILPFKSNAQTLIGLELLHFKNSSYFLFNSTSLLQSFSTQKYPPHVIA